MCVRGVVCVGLIRIIQRGVGYVSLGVAVGAFAGRREGPSAIVRVGCLNEFI